MFDRFFSLMELFNFTRRLQIFKLQFIKLTASAFAYHLVEQTTLRFRRELLLFYDAVSEDMAFLLIIESII